MTRSPRWWNWLSSWSSWVSWRKKGILSGSPQKVPILSHLSNTSWPSCPTYMRFIRAPPVSHVSLAPSIWSYCWGAQWPWKILWSTLWLFEMTRSWTQQFPTAMPSFSHLLNFFQSPHIYPPSHATLIRIFMGLFPFFFPYTFPRGKASLISTNDDA